MKINVNNVEKKFKDSIVLKNINLNFESGKIYGLIGRNGSGKSVFLKMLCGFYQPSNGEILFNGKDYSSIDMFPPDIRALIEKPNFIPELSGYENLELLANIQKKINKKTILDTLDSVNLLTEMDKKYKGLLCINKPIIVSEYLEDGYSKNIEKLFINNPYGYYHYFKECLEMNLSKIPFKKYLYLLKHYILFSYLTKKKKSEAIRNVKGLNKLMILILIIPGYYVSKKRFGKVQ